MKLKSLTYHPYQFALKTGQIRQGLLIKSIDSQNNIGWGDVAPLPKWSQETYEDSINQLNQLNKILLSIDWTLESYSNHFDQLSILPSVAFGLESSLLSILDPISNIVTPSVALLMGTPDEIFALAKQRQSEGFNTAKLKISNLSFNDAYDVIMQLKKSWLLRVDVNALWNTEDSLKFFSQFKYDDFDYVEDPLKNPSDLIHFKHPLAVDEFYPKHLSLKQLELLPTLKAIIYKPTVQGGIAGCHALKKWADKRNVQIVLSSFFESDIGLAHIATAYHRLNLKAPIGIGTYHWNEKLIGSNALSFSNGSAILSSKIEPLNVTT